MENPTWTRKPEESPKAYSAFATYRDMGIQERSIEKALHSLYPNAIRIAGKRRMFQGWSAEYEWVKRCRDYDAEQDRIRLESQAKEVEEMAKRHINIAMLMQSKAVEKLKDAEPKKLSVSDAERLIGTATKIERDARGIPEKIEHVGGVSVNVQFQYNPDAIPAPQAPTQVRPVEGKDKTITGGNKVGQDGSDSK